MYRFFLILSILNLSLIFSLKLNKSLIFSKIQKNNKYPGVIGFSFFIRNRHYRGIVMAIEPDPYSSSSSLSRPSLSKFFDRLFSSFLSFSCLSDKGPLYRTFLSPFLQSTNGTQINSFSILIGS